MLRAAAGPPNEKRRSGQGAALNFSNVSNEQQSSEVEDLAQRAAQFLARRHFVRLPIALVIAAEIGIGGGR